MSDTIWAYVNWHWNEYLDYWELQNVNEASELDDSERAFFRRMKELGEAIAPTLFSLSVGSDLRTVAGDVVESIGGNRAVAEDRAEGLVRAFGSYAPVRDCVRISLALAAAEEMLPRAEDRISPLLRLISARDLSERAAAYLDRATRLFLWGFDSECIIMCHSVFDAALQERVPDEQVWQAGLTKEGAEYTSADRINAALALRILGHREKDLAHRLRRARNDTVHNAPDSVALNSEVALKDLCEILDRLFPPGSV